MQELINDFNKLNEEGLKGNINYDAHLYEKEVQSMEYIQQEYDELVPKIHRLQGLVETNAQKRKEVNDKKFTDPAFVAQELGNIMEASKFRESCKRAHDNIKTQLRDKREKYQDFQLEHIC